MIRFTPHPGKLKRFRGYLDRAFLDHGPEYGVQTIASLMQASMEQLVREFGQAEAERIWSEATEAVFATIFNKSTPYAPTPEREVPDHRGTS